MKRIALLAGTALLVLVATAVVLTARYRAEDNYIGPTVHVDMQPGAAERLAGSVRIRTISNEDPAAFDRAAFERLRSYLEQSFPRVHTSLLREVVGTHSLLYTWQGRDPALEPILLAGHQDVVPIEPGSEHAWQHEPFSGDIADGFIWGRGAIDNKAAVVGILEAVEMLLIEGYRPRRTVYLAFGHDEEVGGSQGAREIAALLARRGVRLQLVLDEGGVIGDGMLPGLAGAVALVGVAEKGFVTIELSVDVSGGHSSLPTRQNAIAILGTAVTKLDTNQMPVRLDGATRQLFDRVGPLLPAAPRVLFANLWATRPVVVRLLERSPVTNAMVRTTTAPTIFEAGAKDNVLPSHARAAVNFRILPGDSIATVVQHVRDVIGDERIAIRVAGRFTAEPSSVSSAVSASFMVLERAIRRVHSDVTVAPYLVVVVTDARYYADISRDVLRFLPIRLSQSDLARMHGTNERIGVEEYSNAVRTYRELIAEAGTR